MAVRRTVNHPAQSERSVNRSWQGWQSASADFVNVASDFISLAGEESKNTIKDMKVDEETVCCPAFLIALPFRLQRAESPCRYADANASPANPNAAAPNLDANLHDDAHTHVRARWSL